MSAVKNLFKGSLAALFGIALVALAVLAGIGYFSSSVSTGLFGGIAFVVVVLALLATYFKSLSVRSGLLFVGIVALLAGAVVYANRPVAKSTQFQAVFLTNGQVYFGHLKNPGGANPVLSDIYYLQSNDQNPQTGTTTPSTTSSSQLSLIKLGSELHGPEDQMVIKADQILFWENLKDSGKVVQAIDQQVKTAK